MRRTVPLLVSIGLSVGVAAAFLPRAVGAAPDPVGPLRIAVVDVLDVVKSASQTVQIDQDDRARGDQIKAWAREQQTKIDQEDGALMLMSRTDPARPAKEHEVSFAKATYDFELKWKMREAGRKHAEALENLFLDVKGVIRRVAAEMSYGLVLNKFDEAFHVQSDEDFALQVAARSVLLYDGATDITKTVKDRLNASRPPAPAAPAPKSPGGAPPLPAPSPGPGLPPPAMGGATPPGMGG